MNTNTVSDEIKILGVILVLPIWLITYSIYLIIFGIKSIINIVPRHKKERCGIVTTEM